MNKINEALGIGNISPKLVLSHFQGIAKMKGFTIFSKVKPFHAN